MGSLHNHILLSASSEFREKTTRPHQMWQTDFTYFKVVGWGWYYLSTVLDDYSRYIVHWELCSGMTAPDVKRSIDAALQKTGLSRNQRPRILSDNGPCYISGELKDYMADQNIKHVRGAPLHPQTQGKIERYHRSMKNVVKLEHYYTPGSLGKAIEAFVEHYNEHRYHESLNNCTPKDVLLGHRDRILKQRQILKMKSMNQRRIKHILESA